MSIDHQDRTLPEPVAAAVAAGTNVMRALREWAGYSVDELVLTSGLTADEIAALEAGDDTDRSRLDRIATALGLPEGALTPD